ncbi:Cmx/CmrA family chloramphenicol efflux MFS transporter [Microlunatus parietis]|uniref:DHA1 family chloramphenicol resistance protein-like MFS transporter n=1 Tax=Microlunatus parietis TaxID=682979 RepID=A0A7Y9LAA3_9ACTN|nr:Cmx/CmrA family chloramphenicol efflux MFS transporter [Microlunatus parietis]NYE69568.1 DHA1 family chloramphenicol resistance protein-like MFS transporter [Microlunatus parietis]
MPFPLYLLALAVFAMGTSEFMLAGLVPALATDLAVPVGTAGLLTSAFAIGMVVGAPLMVVFARRWPRRAALAGFLILFLVAHVAGALTDSFAVLFATRMIAAVTNAGFLAVALSVAVALVPADRKGRALSILLAGTTLATIAGVPGGALLGTGLGWRATFWAIAVLCVPAVLGVLAVRLPDPDRQSVDLGRELGELRRPKLIMILLVGALVNAATFGVFTFLAPVVTDLAGLAPVWVPVTLMIFGLGSFAGVTIAGRLADRRPWLVIMTGGPVLLAGWVALALGAAHPAVLIILVLLLGTLSFGVGSTLIARALYAASGAPTMAGAYATAALNVGAALGPAVAGLSLDTGLGLQGPAWIAGALVAVALIMCVAVQRALR